jgi:3-oxoacyl-[acyl-carrier protein] reductase
MALAADIGGIVVAGDLRIDGEADRVVAEAGAALGELVACVANAGKWPQEQVALVDMSLERWRQTIDDNLTVQFLTARAYLRHVAATGSGSLVLLGSASGRYGDAGRADYAAAKGGIGSGLLLTLAGEMAALSPAGRVNTVVPGWITNPERMASVPPSLVANALTTQALPKLGSPGDVASAVVWLASPAAGHVTGATLEVSGGTLGRTFRPA